MAQATQLTRIPHSRAGKITDQTLDHLVDVGKRAQQGETLTDAEAALILICIPQALTELRQRRAAMDLISDCTDLDNVKFFPAGHA